MTTMITQRPRRPKAGGVDLERQLTAVLEISHVLNLSLGMHDMFQLLAQKVHHLMGYDCAVILLDPDSLLLTWVGYYGISDEYVDAMNEQHNNLKTPEMSRGATGRAFRTHRPAQITNIRHSSVRLWSERAVREGIETFIATPMILRNQVLGFINCYTRHPHRYSPQETELLTIIANQAAVAVDAAKLHHDERRRTEELADLNRLLESQNAQLLKAERIHEQLTAISLSDGGLDEIVQRVANLVRRPVVLYDAGFRQLAAADRREHGDALHRACLAARALSPDLLDAPEVHQSLTQLKTRWRPTRVVWDAARGAEVPRYVVPIRSGRSILAYLLVLEVHGQIGELDRRAVEHGATVVALELVKQRAVLQLEHQLRGGFLDDLLAGTYQDEEVIRRRAAYLGFDLASEYRVFAVGIDPDETARRGAAATGPGEELGRRVASLAEASWIVRGSKGTVAQRGDSVIVVWRESPNDKLGPDEAARILKEEIARSLGGPTVSVGVGSVCRAPADFARSYAEARHCLELLQQFRSADRILSIESLGLQRFLLSAKDHRELVELAHLRLDRLIEHDQKYGVQLLTTLAAFLHAECGLTRTAKRLSLHVNTIQARLQRIQELSSVSLRSPSGLSEVNLALLVASLCTQEFPDLPVAVRAVALGT
jgi:sugar diacid utilization regulator